MGGVHALQKFDRLFLIPGLAHDSTFSRSGTFDPATGMITNVNKVPLPQPVTGRDELFNALREWVEENKPPRRIEVSSPDGSVTMPLCLYPERVTYVGFGSPKSASSYVREIPRHGTGHGDHDVGDNHRGKGHDHGPRDRHD
jgi:Tannase and feruloyl esterase